jgi:hypothetical protein
MSRRNRKANHMPLIVEPHPTEYNGYPFITLIQYRDKHHLTIVDDATEKIIDAFVLDLCTPEGLNEETIIGIVANWYEENSERYPVSIEFSRRGISGNMSKILRTFNIDFVTRVIGPLPKFNIMETFSIKRRRKKSIPHGVEVHRYVSW